MPLLNSTIARNIRNAMDEQNITVHQLSKRLKKQDCHINNVLLCKTEPTLGELIEIEDILDIKIIENDA